MLAEPRKGKHITAQRCNAAAACHGRALHVRVPTARDDSAVRSCHGLMAVDWKGAKFCRSTTSTYLVSSVWYRGCRRSQSASSSSRTAQRREHVPHVHAITVGNASASAHHAGIAPSSQPAAHNRTHPTLAGTGACAWMWTARRPPSHPRRTACCRAAAPSSSPAAPHGRSTPPT